MAPKPPAKRLTDKPVTRDDARPERRKGGLLPALLLITLVSSGAGGAFGIFLTNRVESAVNERSRERREEVETLVRYTGDTRLMRLAPVIANLAEPPDVLVRLEGSIVFEDGALDDPERAAAEIGQDILAYLRTLTLSQLEGPSALQFLREDLNGRAATRTEGAVDELVVETLVVQ